MKKTISALAVAVALGFTGAAGAATIGEINAAYSATAPGFLWQDDDIEWLEVDANGDGLLDVGDTLKGVVKINNISNNGGPGNEFLFTEFGNSSLTGVFETEVKSVSGTAIPGVYDFTFGAVGGDTGTIFQFFENTTTNNLIDITNCGSQAACVAEASNGTLILELGMTGDEDEYWVSTGPLNPDLTGVPTNQALGNFQFGVGVISSSIGDYIVGLPVTAPTFGDGLGDDMVGWNGSGSVLGAEGIGADATATSDTDFGSQKIPSPGVLLLMGLGLAALGAVRRKV